MSRRGERVARPAASSREWEVRFKTRDAAKAWNQLCNTHAANAATAFDHMQRTPRERHSRSHPLRGELAEGQVEGRTCERWQYEVTGAGRLWYLIDERKRTIWLEEVRPGHPKKTEARSGRR